MKKQEKIAIDNIHNSLKKYIDNETNLDFPSTALKSKEQVKKELYHESKEALDLYIQRLKKGIELLHQENLLDQIDPKLLKSLLHQDLKIESFHTILQKELHLSTEKMLSFYTFANSLHQKKLFLEASNVLLFLTLLNPLIAPFWEALGIAEENNHQNESAIMAYTMALDLNPENLNPSLSIAKCFLVLHKPDQARVVLQKVIEDTTDPELKEKAFAILKNI